MRTKLLIICGLLLVGSCTTRGVDPTSKNSEWTLIRVELDPSLITNRGILPTFERPTGVAGDGVPRAKGTLRVNDYGRVACSVAIFEPVVGLGGTKTVIEHPMIRFYGRMSDDGRMFILEDRDEAVRLGRATVLHVQEGRNKDLRLQAATGSRLLPYIYWFKPGARPAPPVNIPYYEGE